MRKVFISRGFAERDRGLVAQVERLVRSHNLTPTSGRNLGGGALTPEISKKIDEADALVALLTVREGDPQHATSPWVRDELAYAVMKGMRTVAIYEKGVSPAGAAAANERIDFEPEDPASMLLRLSEVLGEWKDQVGRLVRVQLLPEDVANQIGAKAERAQVEFRYQLNDKHGAWQRAEVVREVGGVIAYLRVPEDTQMIQLRSSAPLNCESPYMPLRMFIQLQAI